MRSALQADLVGSSVIRKCPAQLPVAAPEEEIPDFASDRHVVSSTPVDWLPDLRAHFLFAPLRTFLMGWMNDCADGWLRVSLAGCGKDLGNAEAATR